MASGSGLRFSCARRRSCSSGRLHGRVSRWALATMCRVPSVASTAICCREARSGINAPRVTEAAALGIKTVSACKLDEPAPMRAE